MTKNEFIQRKMYDLVWTFHSDPDYVVQARSKKISSTEFCYSIVKQIADDMEKCGVNFDEQATTKEV